MEHMQHLHQIVMRKFDDVDTRFDKMDSRIDKLDIRLSRKIDHVQNQVEAIDQRLDTIEIAMVEQQHEKRIRRLEKHTGLVSAVSLHS